MEKSKRKNYKIIVTIFAIFVFIVVVFVLNNVNILFMTAEGLDKPSKLHYYLTERIYKMSLKKDIGLYCIEELDSNKNKFLHDLYIHTLGVIGEERAVSCLVKKYVELQNEKKENNSLYYVINSMGMIGSKDFVPLLDAILKKYDEHSITISKYSIIRALYLITGNSYEYLDKNGEKNKLIVTAELLDARNAILNSRDRNRKFSEMIKIDNLFRPPNWENKAG